MARSRHTLSPSKADMRELSMLRSNITMERTALCTVALSMLSLALWIYKGVIAIS